ncbi:HDOD domain-containing protein [Pseudomonas sp. B392_1p]|uniref:HDOD domain-containing protein n=1 Tax=Pseudomonas sp. B392_1p TaxID=3457507 RepID=UPI003FCF1B4B
MATRLSAPALPPQSLDAWIEHLDSVVLPITRETRRDLLQALHRPTSSLREIAQAMLSSPALALAVLRDANRRRSSSLAEPADNLETALARLGLRRAEALLGELPVMGNEQTPLPLRQLYVISQHARQQAGGLFVPALPHLSLEVQWNTLLFFAPFWTLSMAHPDLILRWAARVFGERRPARQVELELFGVPLVTLGLALVRHWRLSPWIAQGYQALDDERASLIQALRLARRRGPQPQQAQNIAPPLRHWLSRPANSVLFSNALALAAHQAWDDRHSLRWQRLSGLFLQHPLEHVQQHSHRQAVISARQLSQASSLQSLWHPAQALVWPPGCRRSPPAEPAAQLSSFFQREDWQRQCAQLLQQPSPFANLPQLVSGAAAALFACGLRRSALLVTDRQGQLIAQHQSGLTANGPRLKLDPGRSALLSKLIEQPRLLHISADNFGEYAAQLPPLLTHHFPNRHLLLGTLGLHGRGVILLIADQHGVPFSATHLRLVEKTTRCIERALLTFSQRAR